VKQWEQLISVATERIIAALQRHRTPSPSPPTDGERVDMLEQVTSQAPKQGVGYRLVLPGLIATDVPRLSPRRSRTREVAWYSLAPFEYPDDIRLCDGSWYRIVWVDAQGRRIRMRPGEHVPGLRYFVGPAPLQHGASQARQELREPREPMASAQIAESADPIAPQAAALPEPSTQDAIVSPGAAQPEPSHAQDDLETLVNKLASQLSEEWITQDAAAAAKENAMQSSPIAALPPQLAAKLLASHKSLLLTMASLSVDTSRQVIRFVQKPEWMIQLLYEERLAEARATGSPSPTPPPIGLSHDEKKTIHDLLEMESPHFMELCKAVHALARKYGLEVLDCMPTPLPALSEADRERMQSALSNPQKLAYLHHAFEWQECVLRSLPLPKEPQVSLSSKERNQLRRMLHDVRAVILFDQQARPPLSFLQGGP
jgi:hypothetical protein